MENPIKLDDLGVLPLFLETSKWTKFDFFGTLTESHFFPILFEEHVSFLCEDETCDMILL